MKEAEAKSEAFSRKNTKLAEEKKELRSEANQNDDQIEKLQNDLKKEKERGKENATKVVSLEIENEELQNEARRRGYIIHDLELKFDTQLEEIELLQNELEEQKSHNEEQIERLKQQLIELTADLNVKDKELRKIKYK